MSVKNKQKLITLITALILTVLVFLCAIPSNDSSNLVVAFEKLDKDFISLVENENNIQDTGGIVGRKFACKADRL